MLSKQIHKYRAANNAAKLLLKSRSPLGMLSMGQRGYFSLMDRVKEQFQVPLRHLKSFTEPEGQNYESQLPDGYRLHGNTAANFSASITHNALEMN